MSHIRLLFILAFLFVFQTLNFAQSTWPCAAVEMQQRYNQANPNAWEQQQQLDQNIRQWINAHPAEAAKGAAAPVTIPIVVHIIHQNGPENIPDAQILAAVDHLNAAFAHSGYYGAQGSGTNTMLQFCMAQRTPDNQPTNGITRNASPLTNMVMETEDIALKNLNRWDPTQYINIWVVNEISSQSQGPNVAGYAFFAAAHGSLNDGMVCEAQFFGNSEANDVVFIHEMGHYLNLYHTFEGGCSNNFCDLEGDHVCDTPPDQALHSGCTFNSCQTDADDNRPINPFNSDVDDMTENYMDYSPFQCQHAFTTGQSTRMMAALQTARASLLDSPGCLPPCSLAVTADFTAPTGILTGTPVNFTFTGTGATTFDWQVNGVSFSNVQNPTYTFTQPGTYTIEVIAGNSNVNCRAIKKLTVAVMCNITADFSPLLSEINTGETVQFTNNSTGATNYTWKINGTVVGSSPNLNYTFNESGDFVVLLTAANDWCSVSKVGKVSIKTFCGDSISQNYYTFEEPASFRFKQLPDGGLIGIGNNQNNSSQINLIRLAQNGSVVWSKTFNNPNFSIGLILEPLSDGTFIFKTGGPNNSSILRKVALDGTVLWSIRINPSNNEQIYYLKAMENGAFLAGSLGNLIAFDPNGNIIWQKTCSDGVLSTIFTGITYASNIIKVNIQGPPPGIQVSMYLDNAGNIIQQAGIEHNGALNKLENTPDGGIVFVTGDTDNTNFFLTKLNADLTLAWRKRLSSPGNSFGMNFCVNPDGYVFFTLLYQPGKQKIGVFSPAGSLIWCTEPDLSVLGDVFGFEPYQNGCVQSSFQINNRQYEVVIPNITEPDSCFFNPASVNVQDVSAQVVATNWSLYEYYIVNVVPYTNQELTDFAVYQNVVCSIPNSCPEICDNNLDDDNDGLADCADPDCNCSPCDTLPDGAITSVDSIECDGDQLKVWLNICNSGKAIMPAGTPIAFYNSNPTTSNATPLAATQTLGTDIPVDSCLILEFSLNKQENTPIFVVLNDNYTTTRPYNLANFTSSAFPECDYTNNLQPFTFDNSIPTLSLGPDRMVCSNSVTVLSATPGFERYRWQNGSPDISLTAFTPGLYWVDAWDKCGNMYSDSIQLMVQPLGSIDLGPERVICAGDSLALSVNGFASVNWWPNQQLTCATCPDITAKPDSSTVYYVIAANGNCFAGDSVRVTVRERPQISTGSDTISCIHPTVQLSAQITPATTLLQWVSPNNTPLPGINPIVSLPGMYTVTASDVNGQCPASATLFVENATTPPTVNLGADILSCEGETASINTAAQPNTSYLWNTGDTGNTLNINSSGEFILTATFGICSVSDTINAVFNPAPTVNLGPDLARCQGETASITTSAQPNTSYLWNTGDTGNTLNINSSGAFILTATIGICSSSDTINALFNPAPTVNLGADILRCEGETASITASVQPNTSYLWNTGNTGNTLNINNSGEFILTATFGICSVSDTISAIFNPAPTVNLGADILRCEGETASITASVQPNTSYLWNTGTTGNTLTINNSGEYILTATIGICSVSDTINAVFNPAPTISLGPDISRCEGETTSIATSAQPNTSYLWNTGNTGNTLNINNSGEFILTATFGICSVSDTISAIFNLAPTVNLGPDLARCQSETASITTAAQPNTSYLWNTGDAGNTLNINSSGEFILTASIGICSVSDTITALFNLAPTVNLGPDLARCQGETAILNTSAQPNTSYLWNTGDTGNTLTINNSGEYILTATIGICSTADTLIAGFNPIPLFTLGNDTTICTGNALLLSPGAINADSYLWSDGMETPQLNVTEAGIYTLTVTQNECSWTDSILVALEDCTSFSVFIPNIFTPESEDNNAVLQPLFTPGFDVMEYHFAVYDRWGSLVFQTENPATTWDGTQKGKSAPPGVYIWNLQLRYNDSGEKEVRKTGDITLLR